MRLFLLASAVALSGCMTVPMPAYSPVTTAELAGGVSVEPFYYEPRQHVAQDVIYNTGVGTLRISEPVADYVTKAVAREFRQAGLSITADSPCRIGGTITDLAIDDTGFSPVVYSSEIRYRLRAAGGDLMDETYRHQLSTGKQLEPSALAAYLAQVVAGNVAQLIEDPAFAAAVVGHCTAT